MYIQKEKTSSNNLYSYRNNNTEFINYVFGRGAVVFPARENGAPIGKLHGGRYDITSIESMRRWHDLRDIRRFIFRPQSAGLIGVDLDVRHGKNGIKELENIIGDIDHLPHTTTPSAGRHFYFLNDGEDFISSEIAPGAEIKYRAFLTLPGSRRHDGLYSFHGNPGAIPRIPLELLKLIPQRNSQQEIKISSHYKNIELEKITAVLSKQGLDPMPGNRNHYSFQFSRFARKMGHTPESVFKYLSYLITSDFPKTELAATIQSAFFRGKR